MIHVLQCTIKSFKDRHDNEHKTMYHRSQSRITIAKAVSWLLSVYVNSTRFYVPCDLLFEHLKQTWKDVALGGS